jgi:acyl carrier protein
MTEQEKLEFLNSAIAELFKKKFDITTDLDTALVDIGLDSLDIVELQMYYDDKTGHDSPTDKKVVTLRDLMGLMQ